MVVRNIDVISEIFTPTPQKFTSFLPTLNPSKLGFNRSLICGFCGFYKSPIWVPTRPSWRGHCPSSLSVHCGINGLNDDGFYIRRCVELARKAFGFTSPNPMVGCVIVKDGKIVGEGFNPKAGQPHAEVFALRDAGDLAENATAYISLEPCNHFGKTPPCTEALIKAKVKKVVIGMVDPNPVVAYKGVARLRDAGIEVVVGVEEESCKSLNETYIYNMLTGSPFLTLRYSLSVDGKFLDILGDGVMDCGEYYSRLLQEYDAVVLSSSLFGEDFFVPASEEPGANQALHIIIQKCTSSYQIPQVINEFTGNMVLLTDSRIPPDMAQQGIETVVVDQINLNVILDYCNRQGLNSVLLDFRGNFSEFEELAKEGIEKKYFNKFVTEILPVWNGCSKMDSLMPLKSLKQGIEVINLQSKASDQSVVLEGYFKF
ncbi:riboflavin biosynthesis protein PYRD, chloroplastic-like [Abrus precatorius]|uniref:Riboflavin biosynthesis protein PYRD, chloroplastic n=1 Tax=Abrus precatorius TaxID=3816 RepID=A0A8B8L9F8_ABRPR|nr:riboflavin biosynthesis protein PYRD, chloroplastic-like [Abrus precatorius]